MVRHHGEVARNYSDLSPYDFEVLVRDLLQEETGLRLETFPPGRDGGVDVRLYRDSGEQLVVQCKHSPGKRFADIKGELKREAQKVSGKFSVRYMLATTASLTRANKKEIVNIFKGVNLAEGDIWGVDDIENYLRLHPKVEQDNFKLWITSTAILQRLLHPDIYERSAGLVDQMQARAKIYVPSDAFPHAQRILEEHRTCLISGQPGIGKTTLAEMLLLRALSDGWHVYLASEDVSEVERMWRRGEKQAFFYDDFLGQNSLADKLNKNEDSRLAQVIRRVQAAPDKLLILTTREYILQQATQTYEPLRRATALSDAKFILDLHHYTKHQRAHILYNHIYFSGLSKAARASVLEGRRYRNLIDHRNYNPRLVELVTATYKNHGSSVAFSDYAESALDDPVHLWETIFEDQLSELERNLLVVLATFQARVALADLVTAVSAYESVKLGAPSTRLEVMRAIKRLQGTFLRIDTVVTDDPVGKPAGSVPLVRFSNPSFIDYICRYLVSKPAEIDEIVEGCVFFEQTQAVWNWGQRDAGVEYILDIYGIEWASASRNSIMQSLNIPKFTDALLRTHHQETCSWSVSASRRTGERQPLSTRARDLQILRMNQRVNGCLLPAEEIERLRVRCLQRLEGYAREDMDLESERDIVSRLARSECDVHDLIVLRDRMLDISMRTLNRPSDFEVAFRILDIPGLPDFEDVIEREAGLQEKFLDSLARWEDFQARAALSLSDCEEAIEEINMAADVLCIGRELSTPELDRARDFWADVESSQRERVEGNGGARKSLSDKLADLSEERSIDAMFGSLNDPT